MSRDLGRLSQALQVTVDQLDRSNLDWSAWDDTYDFLETSNPEYAESNLVTTTLDSTGMRINFLIYVNLAGDIVEERGFDHRKGESAPVPSVIYTLVDSMRLSIADVKPTKGLIGTTDGLFLLTSRAILTSEIKGPPKGRLVIGRRFDQIETERLGRITSLNAVLLGALLTWSSFSQSSEIVIMKGAGMSPHAIFLRKTTDDEFELKLMDERFAMYRSYESLTSPQYRGCFSCQIAKRAPAGKCV